MIAGILNMKTITAAAILFSVNAFSQSMSKLDLKTICLGKQDVSNSESTEARAISLKMMMLDEKKLVVADKGFCNEFLKQQAEIEVKETISSIENGVKSEVTNDCTKDENNKDKWKIRLYASHSFTNYFNSDITFKSSRYNVEIKDYEWSERSSREFFSPKTFLAKGHNPLQIIDEPTNTFTVSIEKNGNEFFLSAFHPKFYQKVDQVKYMKGTIDGTPVDGFAPINKPFDGYNQTPGESELVRNQNTYGEMNFEVGYGRRFKLLDTDFGSISYIPSIGMGVLVGNNFNVMVKENAWWDFDEHSEGFKLQGVGGSIKNRVEFNSKNERFGLFYENKIAYFHQEHGFFDGTQSYNLGFNSNNVGLKFMIYNPKNKKSLPRR
jgi:hypothetical protein